MFAGHLLCLVLAVMYVGALYLIPKDIQKRSRDDPTHMRYRMYAATAATILGGLVTYLFGYLSMPYAKMHSFNSVIGLQLSRSLSGCFLALVTMSVFYLGPIVTYLTDIHFRSKYQIMMNGSITKQEKPVSLQTLLMNDIQSLRMDYNLMTFCRNLIFAPITEELVFRGYMFPALFSAHCIGFTNANDISNGICTVAGLWKVALICPAFFSLAHVHHFMEKLRSGQPLNIAIIGTVSMSLYTMIFGIITVLMLARTSSLVMCIVSHMFCNFMGLPDTSFMTPIQEHVPGQFSHLYRYRHVFLFLHALGLVLFACTLWPLTSTMAVDSIYWRYIIS